MSGSAIRGQAVTTKTVLGLDPGAHGAIAVLDESGDLLEVFDMPSMPEANGRIATSAPSLAGILARAHARVAFYEFVGARPTDTKVAAFAFGRARGVIEGCAGTLGLPIVFLTSPTWKRLAEIPPGAEKQGLGPHPRNRPVAGRADLFARKCDVDRAEACLIALAGLRRETRR
jgi:crossover junction endodeoxyribonuclease RuvC